MSRSEPPARGERLVPVDPRRARLVQEHVRERVRQVARERDEPVVRLGVDRDRAPRRATATKPCSAGSAPARSRRPASGTRSRPRRARPSRAPARAPRSRRSDGRRRSAPTPAAAAQTPPFVEPTSVTVQSASRLASSTARTWAGSAATGAATTASSAPSSASASDGGRLDRAALAPRPRDASSSGSQPATALDAGPPRGEPDRGADQAGPDDRDSRWRHPIVLPSSEASARISSAKSANSAAGICCGPSQSASSGPRVHLDDDPVRARGDRGPRERQRRGRACPAACEGSTITGRCVSCFSTGTADEVERVARRALEGPDPALAEDHLRVPLLDDVLGRHQELLDRGRRAALQQHRLRRPADLGEQVEVLHVPRADLDHVGDLDHRLDVARVHQLGHERQAGLARAPRRGSRAPRRRAPGTRTARCAA